MVENGTAIMSLTEIMALSDDIYFPVAGIGVTSRVSAATLKAYILDGGVSGTFESSDSKTITVLNGIITGIV